MDGAYDDLLMDHIRNARNFREIEQADQRIEASNELCGDTIELALRWRDGRIAEAAFRCQCCGISMASSSILTERIVGSTRAEARALCGTFLAVLDGGEDPSADAERLNEGQRAVLAAALRYPSRVGCARLAWGALRDALDPPA